MLQIDCPFCGPRAEIEFRCGGEAHIARPLKPEDASDETWRDYLFQRKSPKGVHFERWVHSHGCGRWFNAARDTVTDRFLAIYPMGEKAPSIEELKARLPDVGSPRHAYAENRVAPERVEGERP
ncbi:MAG: sarcosine oxidase subunit delta [Geminicoccaceae bacterium]|nr:sarcosine oxidase subunit delta [Geminicoccaceae bacterium]